jgi:release factor glutamine methyltransferase
MRPNVLEFEPATALFVPDSDPLRFYRRIAELFALPLQGKGLEMGYLFFEINEAYASETEQLLRQKGYTDVRITRDIYGKERIIECKIKK